MIIEDVNMLTIMEFVNFVIMDTIYKMVNVGIKIEEIQALYK